MTTPSSPTKKYSNADTLMKICDYVKTPNNRTAAMLSELLPTFSFAERAVILTERGIPVIPLHVQSKEPCTAHAAYDATTNTEIIVGWGIKFDRASNCAAVAQFAGFWMLDDDTGTLAQKYKEDTGQDLPSTFTIQTSRGFHYYFKHDDASSAVRYDGHDNSGVIEIPEYKGEARCNNQYVVGPYSIHPSGAIYAVHNAAPIVAAPVALLEWLQKSYALNESLKAKSGKPKIDRKADPNFGKLFDAVGYRPLLKRINAMAETPVHVAGVLSAGKTYPCPMPQHKHGDYSNCFGAMKDAPDVLHCLGNCQWTGDMVAAVCKIGGYTNMYNAARAICAEEKLKFEDFFPPIVQPAEAATPETHRVLDVTSKPPVGDYRREGENKPARQSSNELVFSLPAVDVKFPRDYVVAPPLHEKCGWFPCGGAPSVLAGPSGANKTTWMYQLLMAQKYNQQFHGHETQGFSFITLGRDRGIADHLETMERMHLSPDAIPFVALSALLFDLGAVQAILNHIEATVPMPKIVFVEGADMLIEKDGMKTSSMFMHYLHQISERYNIAIIVSMGSPKVKEGAGYEATRDNIIGSTGWGRSATTVALLQFSKTRKKGRRVLTIEPRNAPPEKFILDFVQGRLEVQPDDPEDDGREEQANGEDQENSKIAWYKTQARLAETDPTKKWWTILDMERALGMPASTAYKHVRNDKTKHYLERKSGKKQGVRGEAAEYRWNASKTNPKWVEDEARNHEVQAEVF
jgi:hypothetical protein